MNVTPPPPLRALARLVLAGAFAVALLALPLPARAQQVGQRLAATDYYIDYSRSAHGFADMTPIVPRFLEGTPWARMKEILARRRRSNMLYLVGDDAVHVSPTRVGILGWGVSAEYRF